MPTTALPSKTLRPAHAMPPPGEQHLLLHDFTWGDYVALGNLLCDRATLRLTFDRGSLELMTTSPKHEIYKKWLGRFIETPAEEFNLKVATAGHMTFQRQDLSCGLEPDDCFWIAHEQAMRGKLTWDPTSDPPPDLALEIEVSRSAIDRMGLYAALKVPEVWCFDGTSLQVHLLQSDGTYHTSENSPTFPGVTLAGLVRFLQPSASVDYLGVIQALRQWVREQLGRN